MVRALAVVSVVAGAVGCGAKSGAVDPPAARPAGSTAAAPSGSAAAPAPALRIAFGDCSREAREWVSGPAPRPFDDAALRGDPALHSAPPRPQAAGPRPTLRLGKPTMVGDLDGEIVLRNLRGNVTKLAYCYEKLLLEQPGLAGELTAQIRITPSGTVASATASGVDLRVGECIAWVIRGIEFPKPKTSGVVEVTLPITLDPDVRASAPAAVRGAPAPTAAPHQPGAANPLRGEQAALAACLRTHEPAYGAAVIELVHAGGGAAAHAEVHGLADGPARACVAEVALRVAGASTATQMCPLAFGQMPVEALPTLELNETIVLGKPVEGSAQVVGGRQRLEGHPDPRLEQAIVELGGWGPASPVLAVRGPIVIRAHDRMSMAVVLRAARAVNGAAGSRGAFVLAALDDGVWRSLEALALPAVPVPRHAGRQRFANTGLAARTHVPEGSRPELVIAVEAARIRIGIGGAVREVPAGDDAALDRELAAHKASAAFADRADLVLLADDVRFGDVVTVIEAITRAGFVDWTFATRY